MKLQIIFRLSLFLGVFAAMVLSNVVVQVSELESHRTAQDKVYVFPPFH